MLLIPNASLLSKELVDSSVNKYLSDTGIGSTLAIPSAKKAFILNQLGTDAEYERFGFMVDVFRRQISHCIGLSRWLGYTDSQFSVKNYLSIIHPAHAVVYGFYVLALLDFMCNEKLVTEDIMGMTYVSLIALRHKNGSYIYCKKESKPLHVTVEGKIMEYCDVFTVIKEFNNELYDFRIYDADSQRHDVQKKIRTAVKHYFEKKAGFSVQELRILKRYGSYKNTTSEKIATSFKIEKSTVATYNKRILDKTENIFERRFENAQKVAEYLHHMYLI